MSGTKICLGSLVVALLGLGELHAQDSNYATGVPGANMNGQALNATPGFIVGGNGNPAGSPPLGEPAQGTTLSSYILYPYSGIGCAPLVDGPITWDIFVRSGLSWNVSHGALGEALGMGWEIEGGGRSLFWNQANDAAWTISVSASNERFNHSQNTVTVSHNYVNTTANAAGFPVTNVVTQDVTIAGLNRTFANLALGREYYLVGCANQTTGWSWNIGGEAGFKFGSDTLYYEEIQHLTKDSYGVLGALYSNIEVPFNGAFLTAGLRLEFDTVWSDILQKQNNSNVEDINLLFQVGIRF